MTDFIDTDLRFSIVPHWVTNSDVSDRALRLYSVLAKFADAETGQAFPGRTRLSKELRCSLKSVDRAVAELESIGAVRKTQRVKDGHYQSSLYTVVRIDPASGKSRPRVTDDATPCQDGRDPVSPVTHRTITTELEPKNDIKKATKIGQYEPNQELRDDLTAKYPDLDFTETLEAFRDYHLAKGSTFKDWDAAVRTWWRNARKFAEPKKVMHLQEKKPAAEGPGKREWVLFYHNGGQHWACNPGEFGCK
jgi:hypothetical protein